MDIPAITISDDQAAALAAMFRVTSYTDGGDFISQIAAAALLQYNKQQVISSVAASSDPDAVSSLVDAWNAAAPRLAISAPSLAPAGTKVTGAPVNTALRAG